MPSSVQVNGSTVRRSGVYGIPDVIALSGRTLGTGRLAVVGQFPWIEKAVPVVYTSESEMRRAYPGHPLLDILTQCCWHASADDRVGQPSAVLLVNAQPCTQATKTLLDANGSHRPSVILNSRLWGSAGNRVHVTVSAGTTQGKKFVIVRDGVTETFDDLAYPDVLSVQYTGTDVTTMAAEAGSPTAFAFKMSFTKTAIAAAATWTPVNLVNAGAITIIPSTGPGVGEHFDAVVTGTNLATGLTDTESLTWAAGSSIPTPTTKTWSKIATVAFTVSAGTPTWTVTGTSVECLPADYPTVQHMADVIDALPDYTCTVSNPKNGGLTLSQLDSEGSTALATPFIATANQQATVDGLAGSALVECVAAGDSVGQRGPDNWVGFLATGTQAAASGTDWTDALNSLRTEEADILTVLDTTEAYQLSLRSHIAYMCGAGAYERAGWVGAVALSTRATLRTRVRNLNTRHLGVVFQGCSIYNGRGVLTALGPEYMALLTAACEAGLPRGQTLLTKRPNIVSWTCSSTIKPNEDLDGLIGDSLVTVVDDRTGKRFDRAVTSYVTDDNPVYTEKAANRSLNESILDLRNYLKIMIGDGSTSVAAASIRSTALGRLEWQKKNLVIKDFVPASVAVDDLGDTYSVEYALATIEPINFILVKPHAIRIPASV